MGGKVTGKGVDNIGCWREDAAGLPIFCYTGRIPYSASLEDGRGVKLPEDPWFLLGNDQLTLFTHVSGRYELLSGQRSWARVNQGPERNSGDNYAAFTCGGREYPLVGMDSLAVDPEQCRRSFGCGFGSYQYQCGDIRVERKLSVKPSLEIGGGTSAFLLEIYLENQGGEAVEWGYCETVTAHYEEIQFQTQPEALQKVKYAYSAKCGEDMCAIVIQAATDDPLLCSDRYAISRVEGFPPSLFMKRVSGDLHCTAEERTLRTECGGRLQPGESHSAAVIIGYSFETEWSDRRKICERMEDGADKVKGLTGAYAGEWRKLLPDFAKEPDQELRRELIWHVYNLEAMATYSEYFGETKIPQGTIYDYDWGAHASARDNFQHALPLVYCHPALAKSVLRYMCKRTTAFGEIRLIELGNGYADNERYFTSDQQLFFFLLLTEYLRVTGDVAFLGEKVTPYPVRGQREMPVLEFAEKCFVFLRDTVGTGSHGLVRLLNSDWNDAVYYIEKVPYNNIFLTGESHMNSAMALSIFQDLIPILRKAAERRELAEYEGQLNRLAESVEFYRNRVGEAFLKDMEGRTFPRRMYFAGKPYGEDNMFLEPQGYTLQIRELTTAQKKALYHEMCRRVYAGEKLGAREQETPEFEDSGFDKGSRENGGFWWALNGPVIVGVAGFDKEEAWKLLNKMTLQNFAKEFPQYWSSYWSAADNLESSLIPEEGLPDQTDAYANIPVYCAHPHAWILYCYYRIKECTAELLFTP